MLTALAHRGPDGTGEHSKPGVALGVRRLALVDVDGDHQPFADNAGLLTVVVNGELFDHAEERRRLEGRGARFKSRCDSEVWPHALQLEGLDYFERAHG
ncbi:MAG: hypothetical protein Q8O67_21465 [Deltaproteobacteria bacterium]|nr:hypothetical protein [Deltaproteobacteria bacterium]